jgi:hypothetical protein
MALTNKGRGRPPGAPNKLTAEFKTAVNELLTATAPDMLEWLRDISLTDKPRAIELVIRLAEFCYPKLARTEVNAAVVNTITGTVKHEHSVLEGKERDAVTEELIKFARKFPDTQTTH